MAVCPLIFDPIYKPKMWGGRRLANMFGRVLPPDQPIGESWEVADLEDEQSVARNDSPVAGQRLGQLVASWGGRLLGAAEPLMGRFPLLVKYLDACDDLSVQVHPDRATAEARGGPVRVKNEAWYVLRADPGACIYRGLVEGIDRTAFVAAVEAGTVDQLLRRIPVSVGECYYLPSGTVHALGAGVVVAEVQTPSDVTYRVFDWNRVDPTTGRRRQLHVEEALRCIAFGRQEFPEEVCQPEKSVWPNCTRLVSCDSFLIDRVEAPVQTARTLDYGELVIWTIVKGAGRIDWGEEGMIMFRAGDTMVFPAGLGDWRVVLSSDAAWLEVRLPRPKAVK